MSRLLPHIPPHTPYTSIHSPRTTVQPPHSIPSAPHNLIPSPSAQTLINTSTSKSNINPPQSQEHTAVSQHGYPYAVLMSDSLSLTSSITMPVLQDTGLLLISVMLFMQGRCRVVVEWSPRNPLMLKLSEGGCVNRIWSLWTRSKHKCLWMSAYCTLLADCPAMGLHMWAFCTCLHACGHAVWVYLWTCCVPVNIQDKYCTLG